MTTSRVRAGLDALSVREAMLLWGELVEALNGVNGYGGSTAELYAYRFGAYSPGLALQPRSPDGPIAQLHAEYMQHNADVLGSLLDAFIDEHSDTVRIAVDGKPHRRGSTPAPFDHRVHVHVTPRCKP